MQARILSRETGDLAPRDFNQILSAQLLRSYAPAPNHRFNGERAGQTSSLADERPHSIRAHGSGVGSLVIDRFDGRILLSGGAEGSIKLWDLEACGSPHASHTFRPVSSIGRTPGGVKGGGHSHGVTHLAFFPFDREAFLSSSYDKTLKLWSTQHCSLSAEFDLSATIYSHATSPIADHLLVACATQNSNVRLVDLKSGSAVQALVAHGGPVLCAAWSPRHEHILVSGHADGKARVWDVRRAGGVLSMLDQEDSLGIVHKYTHAIALGQDWSRIPRFRASAQAHDDAVNGVCWTDDGRYIVTSGLDRRLRVWDADTGANTLASFGSLIQNQQAKTANFCLSPSGLSTDRGFVIWANEQEILILDLHEGHVVSRLKSPGLSNPLGPRSRDAGRGRITSIAWRGCGGGSGADGPIMGGGNSVGALYSAHLDGQIRAWMPFVAGDDDIDDDEAENRDDGSKSKKRKAVDDAYRSLMGKQVTFS